MTHPDREDIIEMIDSETMEIITDCINETDSLAYNPIVEWTSEGTYNADES